MTNRLNIYFTAGLMTFAFLFSCENEEHEAATITFYPTLEAEGVEPEAGVAGTPVTVKMKTSRVLAVESQVNIRIAGEGAGYGYSYTTTPPMLQPGVVTVTIPSGETDAEFTFTPKNDGIFVPTNYKYTFTIAQMSNSINSVGQAVYRLGVKDQTEAFLSHDFDECSGTPTGFVETIVPGTAVMQLNTWGCSGFGYPNETTKCAEANAYGKGGTAPSNSYLILNEPVDGTDYSTLFVSAQVYSRYTGQGQIKFKYSTNYTGAGNPEAEGVVWNDLTGINESLPAAGSQAWTEVGTLIENVGDEYIYIAIQFVGGTSSSSSSWRIDNFEIKGI